MDNSVWWQWTPAATGTATFSTEDNGSNITTFDTTLTVYTGNTLNSLTPIAFDDDSGTGNRSLTVFPVNARHHVPRQGRRFCGLQRADEPAHGARPTT